jgi:hypothetical protein
LRGAGERGRYGLDSDHDSDHDPDRDPDHAHDHDHDPDRLYFDDFI